MTGNEPMVLPLRRFQQVSFLTGTLAAILCIVGASFDLQQFLQSYLVSFLYWWTVTAGCLGLTILHKMTGGEWGVVAQPFLRAGIRVFPLVAIAFVPIALGLKHIYPWADETYFEHDSHAHNRRLFLSEPFFLGRAATYFGVCLGMALMVAWRRSDEYRDSRSNLAGLCTVLLTLVVTFAAIDWAMTLEPDWMSTLYGGIFAVGALMLAVCLATAGTGMAIAATDPANERMLDVLQDLGKLLLAFLMVWSYFELSQFLIIYSGDLPIEVVWYQRRLQNGWQWFALALVLLQFAIPFACLLSYDVKRHPKRLTTVAIGVAAMHAVKLFWTVTPAFSRSSATPHWLDVMTFLALGGIWLTAFFRQLKLNFVTTPVWPAMETNHD